MAAENQKLLSLDFYSRTPAKEKHKKVSFVAVGRRLQKTKKLPVKVWGYCTPYGKYRWHIEPLN